MKRSGGDMQLHEELQLFRKIPDGGRPSSNRSDHDLGLYYQRDELLQQIGIKVTSGTNHDC